MKRLVYSLAGCLFGLVSPFTSSATAQVDATRTVVSIEATSPIAEESSYPYRRLAFVGAFTISRTGPTNDALPVFVSWGGSATAGVDYPNLPWMVSIPAGARSVGVRVEAKPDDAPEPIETVVATIGNCPPDREPRLLVPCYDFDVAPAQASATVFVRDDGITEASIAVTRPRNGELFKVGQTILVEAVAIDLNGYISRVEFFDGDKSIGVSELFFLVAPKPGTPINHSFEWRGAEAGGHVLTARTRLADGSGVVSLPVRIGVEGDVPPPVVVRIEATRPVAEEDSAPLERLPLVGEFTIARSGPTNGPTSVFLHVGGTATPGKDYEALPLLVSIPPGATSTAVRVKAIPDDEPEGVETVIAKLSACPPETDPPLGMPCYAVSIDPLRASATVSIRDNPFATNRPPVVAIVRPVSGTKFPVNTPISILAEARDPDGYTHKAEFFADGRRIGEVSLEFLVPPPPGETQRYEFVWRLPEPGSHRLTVRVVDNRGASGMSPAVEIAVAPDEALPVVTVIARDCFASEPGLATVINPAAFLVRRYGPTNAPLTVSYSLGGTAENGVDYEKLTGTATIPAGRRSALVMVRPLADDIRERYETVVLRLEAPALDSTAASRYVVGRPASALAIIADEPWTRFAAGLSCRRLDQHCALVALNAEAGFQYRVEASDDLRTWETLCVHPAVEPAVIFIDEDLMDGRRHRFYRISPEPVALVE